MLVRKHLFSGLSLLALYLASCSGQTDLCAQQSSQVSCDTCIRAHPDCLWCPHLPAMNETTTSAMSITHCYNRTTYDTSECPEPIQDPISTVNKTDDRPLSSEVIAGVESVQVRPQAVQTSLRLGSPQSFNMSFIALRNLVDNTTTSQNIRVSVPVVDGYTVTIEPLECWDVTGETSCRVVFDEIITFRVTVELTDCSAGRQRITLRGVPYVFTDITAGPECECGCSAEQFHQESSSVCGENGTLICGACRCNEGRFGTFCECDQEVTGGCVTFNGMECGGPERGTCSSCGECMCNPPFFSADLGCRCDNTSCPAGCELNGECVCAEPPFCRCTRTAPLSGELFFGSDCSCNPDELCFNTNWISSITGRQAWLCQVITNEYRTGQCTCSGCDCSVSATGINGLTPNSNLCVPNDPSLLCTYFAPCIACALRGTLDDCMSTCLSHLNYTVVPEALIDSVEYFPPCLTTVDGRSYEFYVGRDIFLQAVIIDASGSLLSLTPLVTAVGIVLAFVLQA